jgi:hypothetical protein
MFPGFLNSVTAGDIAIPLSVKHLYTLCWPGKSLQPLISFQPLLTNIVGGFLISGTVYVVLCRLSPVKGVGEVDEQDYFGTFGYVASHLSFIFPS